jgi:hypothetical protein
MPLIDALASAHRRTSAEGVTPLSRSVALARR